MVASNTLNRLPQHTANATVCSTMREQNSTPQSERMCHGGIIDVLDTHSVSCVNNSTIDTPDLHKLVMPLSNFFGQGMSFIGGRRPLGVTIERQGDLVRVTRRSIMPSIIPPPQRPVRGDIIEFSRKSRKRLFTLFARLDSLKIAQMTYKPRFITLTYPDTYPDPRTAKANMRAFIKRIRRWFPEASFVWRLEFQSRGAPHIHLVAFGMRYKSYQAINRAWCECAGISTDNRNACDIEVLRSLRGVMYYVSKYLAKPEDSGSLESGEGGVGLSVVHIGPGRLWGTENRAALPFAELEKTELIVDEVSYRHAAESLEHAYASTEYSFDLFADNAELLYSTFVAQLQRCENWNARARVIYVYALHDVNENLRVRFRRDMSRTLR